MFSADVEKVPGLDTGEGGSCGLRGNSPAAGGLAHLPQSHR